VTSVGRLDKDTSGLILITDIGPLVQKYTSPKSDSEKVYEAELDGDLPEGLADLFASGSLVLRNETKPCKPAHLEVLAPRQARLTITEGRYHQVRRMFASQGLQVTALHRTQLGAYELGDLKEGERIVHVVSRSRSSFDASQ
jgi:16S rRNA pseudouridine516 synthase